MTSPRPPWTLLLTILVAVVEGVGLLVLGALDVARVGSASSAVSAVAGGLLFVVCGAGVGWCAYALWRLQSWARAPLVVVQLIVLGVAWNSRGDLTSSGVLALLAVVALVGIFLPPSIRALEQS